MDGIDVDLLLADYAQIHGGKLFISGAAIQFVATRVTPAGRFISVFLAGVVRVGWNQHEAGHRLVVELLDADGGRVPIAGAAPDMHIAPDELGAFIADFTVGRAPQLLPGASTVMPVVVPVQCQVPSAGGYTLRVSVDGQECAHVGFQIVDA